MKRTLTVVGFMLITLLMLQAVGAQSFQSWSQAERVGRGWWQSVTVDRIGQAHVTWYGQISMELDTDSLMYRRRAVDGTWTPEVDVIYAANGGYTVRNAIDVTTDGQLYAYFRSETAHTISSVHVSEATSARNWRSPLELGDGYYIDMMIDDNDVIHVVSSTQGINQLESLEDRASNTNTASEGDPCAFCADLIYRQSENMGRTWSNQINLSNTWTGSERPEIWQGLSGRLYVNWDEGSDWYIGRGEPTDVRFVYSDDDGQTWSDPIVLDGGPNLTPMQFGLTELDGGTLLAVWRDQTNNPGQPFFQISEDVGETWSDPELVPGITTRNNGDTPLDDYELLTDRNGNGQFFMVGHPPGGPRTMYQIEYRQNRWQTPQIVYQGDETTWPEWPKAAIGPQNEIHLTWFVRLVRTDARGNFNPTAGLEVYYAYREPTRPDLPIPTFEPTITPTEALAAAPTFEPTLTPFPTVEPLSVANTSTTGDLYAIETVLTAAFAVMLLLGGVVYITGFRPRRFW